MPNEPDLSQALTDVRKAYRLLWAYQKRVFDIVELMADQFEDMSFYYWQTVHSNHPCNSGTNPFERWGWDMLPMVRLSYLYLPSGIDRNSTQQGQWMLEIHVDSDSGYETPEDETEPDPENFEETSESTSTIRLYAWYFTGTTGLNWLNGVWQRMNWPEVDGEPVDSASPPFRIVRTTLNIANLPDKDAVRAAASEFKAMASKALGVTLT